MLVICIYSFSDDVFSRENESMHYAEKGLETLQSITKTGNHRSTLHKQSWVFTTLTGSRKPALPRFPTIFSNLWHTNHSMLAT